MATEVKAWQSRDDNIVLFLYVSDVKTADRVRNSHVIPNVVIPSDAFAHTVDPGYALRDLDVFPNVVFTALTPAAGRVAIAKSTGSRPEDINYALQITVRREDLGRIVPYGDLSFQSVTDRDIPVKVDEVYVMGKPKASQPVGTVSIDNLVGERSRKFYMPPAVRSPAYARQ